MEAAEALAKALASGGGAGSLTSGMSDIDADDIEQLLMSGGFFDNDVMAGGSSAAALDGGLYYGNRVRREAEANEHDQEETE